MCNCTVKLEKLMSLALAEEDIYVVLEKISRGFIKGLKNEIFSKI
jgi:hypothetical protein